MRRAMVWMVLAVGLPLVSAAGKGLSTYQVVCITDIDNSKHYQAVSMEEYRQLQQEIRDEAKFKTKALWLAQKEWKADPSNRGIAFPRGAIGTRSVRSTGRTYRRREDAEQAALDMESKALERAERHKIQQEQNLRFIEEQQRRMSRGRRSYYNRRPKKSKYQIELEKKRKAKKEEMYDRARQLYQQKLDELKQLAAQQAAARKAAQEDALRKAELGR